MPAPHTRTRSRNSKHLDKIFCLETEFKEKDLKNTASAEGVLRYLADYDDFEFIYKKAPTLDAFDYYLDSVLKPKYKAYTLIYIPTHASPGAIGFANRGFLDIEDLANKYEGRFEGRIIHFGGCSLLNLNETDLMVIKKKLGAKLITGYTKNVGSIHAIAFEILLFSGLQRYVSKLSFIQKYMYKEHPSLAKELGFIAL
jgi:hypothetical protein